MMLRLVSVIHPDLLESLVFLAFPPSFRRTTKLGGRLFFIFSARRGRESEALGGEGGIGFVLKITGEGGGSRGRRVFVANWGILGGGGYFFFSGPKRPPRKGQSIRTTFVFWFTFQVTSGSKSVGSSFCELWAGHEPPLDVSGKSKGCLTNGGLSLKGANQAKNQTFGKRRFG